MGIYGKIFLINEKAKEKQYNSLDVFMFEVICDEDFEKFELCQKYCIDKIKPIQKIVKQAISNLKMNQYCKDVFYYKNDYWMHEGIEIAKFDHNKMKKKEDGTLYDFHNDDEYDQFFTKLRKESSKLIKEIEKLNTIKFIKIDFMDAEHNEGSEYNPAVYINISKFFFKEFLDKYPKKTSENRTAEELKRDQKIITEKINSIVDKFNTNSEYKKIIFDEKTKERCKSQINYLKYNIESLESELDPDSIPVDWLSKYDPEYSGLSKDKIISKYIKNNEGAIKEEITKYEKQIEIFNNLLKEKLSDKIKLNSTISNKEMIFYLNDNLKEREAWIIQLSNFYSKIVEELKSDEEVKNMNITFNHSVSEKKIQSVIKKLSHGYFSVIF